MPRPTRATLRTATLGGDLSAAAAIVIARSSPPRGLTPLRVLLRTGNVSRAIRRARRGPPRYRLLSLLLLAAWLHDQGDTDAALHALSHLPEAPWPPDLPITARLFLAAADLDPVVWRKLIAGRASRDVGHLWRGLLARAHLRLALDLADRLPEDASRQALDAIAAAYASRVRTDEVLNLLDRLSRRGRGAALGLLALHHPAAVDAARASRDERDNPFFRRDPEEELAFHLAQARARRGTEEAVAPLLRASDALDDGFLGFPIRSRCLLRSRIAASLLAAGAPDHAASLFDRASQESRGEDRVHVLLSWAQGLSSAKRRIEARPVYREALVEARSCSPSTRLAVARSLAASGFRRIARRVLVSLVRSPPPPPAQRCVALLSTSMELWDLGFRRSAYRAIRGAAIAAEEADGQALHLLQRIAIQALLRGARTVAWLVLLRAASLPGAELDPTMPRLLLEVGEKRLAATLGGKESRRQALTGLRPLKPSRPPLLRLDASLRRTAAACPADVVADLVAPCARAGATDSVRLLTSRLSGHAADRAHADLAVELARQGDVSGALAHLVPGLRADWRLGDSLAPHLALHAGAEGVLRLLPLVPHLTVIGALSAATAACAQRGDHAIADILLCALRDAARCGDGDGSLALADALLALAEAEADCDRVPEIRGLIDRLPAVDASPRAVRLADILEQAGDPGAALAVLSRPQGDTAVLIARRAVHAFRHGTPAEARACLDQLEPPPRSPRAHRGARPVDALEKLDYVLTHGDESVTPRIAAAGILRDVFRAPALALVRDAFSSLRNATVFPSDLLDAPRALESMQDAEMVAAACEGLGEDADPPSDRWIRERLAAAQARAGAWDAAVGLCSRLDAVGWRGIRDVACALATAGAWSPLADLLDRCGSWHPYAACVGLAQARPALAPRLARLLLRRPILMSD